MTINPQRLIEATKHLSEAITTVSTLRSELLQQVAEELPRASNSTLVQVAEVLRRAPAATLDEVLGLKPVKPTMPARKTSSKSTANAAAGRAAVASGERPPLRNAMAIVMGGKTMNAQAVLDALGKHKWQPTSNDPRQYISYMLNNNCPEYFVRTPKRGHYKLSAKAKEIVQQYHADQKAVEEDAKKVNADRLWVFIKKVKGAFVGDMAKAFGRSGSTFGAPLGALQRQGKVVQSIKDGKAWFEPISSPRRNGSNGVQVQA